MAAQVYDEPVVEDEGSVGDVEVAAADLYHGVPVAVVREHQDLLQNLLQVPHRHQVIECF